MKYTDTISIKIKNTKKFKNVVVYPVTKTT